MRLTVPCRAVTCCHLQCFDAALYLQMNEKKPTWICPVCDKKAAYESLIIDGLVELIYNFTHYFCIYLYLFLILITWFPKMWQKRFVKYFVFGFFLYYVVCFFNCCLLFKHCESAWRAYNFGKREILQFKMRIFVKQLLNLFSADAVYECCHFCHLSVCPFSAEFNLGVLNMTSPSFTIDC